MKKLRLLIVLGIIAALAIPFSVYAATSDSTVAKTVRGFFGIDFSKLNDQQKADVQTYSQKMADLEKEFVEKMVSNGTLTREQGDAEIKRIDEALKASQDNSTAYGFGIGKGFVNGKEKHVLTDKSLLDTSKLTDQQKSDLTAAKSKITDLQKEYIDKLVSFGLLTKEQGDSMKSKLDEILASDKTDDSFFGVITGKRGFPGFGLFGIVGADTSKLTDQQKAELKDYSKKMAELQKEVVNKLVEYGVMTKDQGDAAIKRIDAMSELDLRNGLPGATERMRKSRPGGWTLPEKPDAASNSDAQL